MSSAASTGIFDITYPPFVAIFSWIILGNQCNVAALHIVGIISLGFFAANIFLAICKKM